MPFISMEIGEKNGAKETFPNIEKKLAIEKVAKIYYIFNSLHKNNVTPPFYYRRPTSTMMPKQNDSENFQQW